MKIRFILDRFREHDRRQLNLIKEILEYRPNKLSDRTRFLRSFTLAILQQYNKKIGIVDLPSLNEIPEKINLNINYPQVPRKINFKFKVPDAPEHFDLAFKLENPPEKLELL